MRATNKLKPGRCAEARGLLTRVYGWVTEGLTKCGRFAEWLGHDNMARDDSTSEERKRMLILDRKAQHMFTRLTGFAPFLERDRGGRRQHLDIECLNGIWVESIHRKQRSRDQRLKTKVSTRKLALAGRCSMRVSGLLEIITAGRAAISQRTARHLEQANQ
jgi:hypothetical protein